METITKNKTKFEEFNQVDHKCYKYIVGYYNLKGPFEIRSLPILSEEYNSKYFSIVYDKKKRVGVIGKQRCESFTDFSLNTIYVRGIENIKI